MLRPLLLSLVVLLPVVAQADDAVKPEAAVSPLTEKLIKDLSSTDFNERREAGEKLLAEASPEVISALQEAALSPSAEVGIRALTVLRRIYQERTEAELKEAAKKALEAVASSESSLARVAKGMLEVPANNPLQPVMNRGVRISVTNGHRTMTVNQDSRTVTFEDDGGRDIKVEVTRDGKIDKFEAKDVDDLKKQQPELGQMFEQYSKGIQIGINRMPPGFPALPGFPGGKNIDSEKVIGKIEAALKKLDSVEEQLDEMELNKEEKQALVRELREMRKDLYSAQAALE